MAEFFDDLEVRSDEQRAEFAAKVLPEHLNYVINNSTAYKKSLGGFELDTIKSIEALQKLPILRKSDLVEGQKAHPPLGGFNACPIDQFDNLFQSPGPIFEPGKSDIDWWRGARGLFASGFRSSDIVQNCFSYHLTPAGMMYENACKAIGATVLPAGTGQTEMQVSSCAQFSVSAYVGTPDYLKIILEKADDVGCDLSSLKKAHVGGGALFPSLRREYNDRGISCYQSYGTADLGLIAYETEAVEGMVIDEGVFVEIVVPGTGKAVVDGEVGEVVVTTLNRHYPLIRFATGDLSAFLDGRSPCGRTNKRIKGWMGRADQTTKIKGMFVRPEQVAEFVEKNENVAKARLVVTRQNQMDLLTIKVESLAKLEISELERSVKEVFKLKGNIDIFDQNTLPKDGKVIEDLREYD